MNNLAIYFPSNLNTKIEYMKYSLQILGKCSRGLTSSIAFIDQISGSTYLFNTPDSIQRIMHILHFKFTKVQNIFLSSIHPENIWGLPGFLLTMRDMCKDKKPGGGVNIYGPKGTVEMFNPATCCLQPRDLFLFNHFAHNNTEFTPTDPEAEDFMSRDIIKYSDGKLNIIPIILNNREKYINISYLIQPPPSPKKLDGKKAMGKGAKGNQLKDLKDGVDVVLKDGTTILAADVLIDGPRTNYVLILFVPNIEYISELVSHPILNNIEYMREVRVIYHSCTMEVLTHPLYQEFFTTKFGGTGVTHLMDNTEINGNIIYNIGAHMLSSSLNLVNPIVFPCCVGESQNLGEINKPLVPEETKEAGNNTLRHKELLTNIYNSNINKVEFPPIGMFCDIYPKISLTLPVGNVECITPDILNKSTPKLTQNELNIALEKDTTLRELHQECLKPCISCPKFEQEPTFVILGSVSAAPGRYRNVSGIYMCIPPKNIYMGTGMGMPVSEQMGIILDCAEGSHSQLLDHVGEEHISQLLYNLHIIYITHAHFDHHPGMFKLLKERDDCLRRIPEIPEVPTLYIIIPRILDELVTHSLRNSDLKYPESIRIIHSNNMNPNPNIHFSEIEEENSPDFELTAEIVLDHMKTLKTKLFGLDEYKEFYAYIEMLMGIKFIYTVETDHCMESFGVVIEGPGWKICYTGDTRPATNLVNYSSGVTLLIHENTHEDGLEEEALLKYHSTTKMALQQGIYIYVNIYIYIYRH